MKLTRKQLRKLIQETFIGSGPIYGRQYDEDEEFDSPYNPKHVFKSGKEKLKKSIHDLGFEGGSELFDSDDPENVASGINLATSFDIPGLTKQEEDILGGYPGNIETLKTHPTDQYAWKYMNWEDYLYKTSVYTKFQKAVRQAAKNAKEFLESKFMSFMPKITNIKNLNSQKLNHLRRVIRQFIRNGSFKDQFKNLENAANYLENTKGTDHFGYLISLEEDLIDAELAKLFKISDQYLGPSSHSKFYGIVPHRSKK